MTISDANMFIDAEFIVQFLIFSLDFVWIIKT